MNFIVSSTEINIRFENVFRRYASYDMHLTMLTIKKLMLGLGQVISAQNSNMDIDNLISAAPDNFLRPQRGFNPSIRCKPLLEMAKATANMGVYDDYIYRILARDCPTKKTLRPVLMPILYIMFYILYLISE